MANTLRYSKRMRKARSNEEQARLPDDLYGPRKSALFHGSPSAHTTTAFGAATTVLVAVPEIGVPALFLAGTIGWARMATLSHHPLDVMLGIFLGSFFGVAAGAPLRRLRRRLSAPP